MKFGMLLAVFLPVLAVLVAFASQGRASASSRATPPIHIQGAAISASEARFQWLPGRENRYFCLDYAKSVPDLLSLTATWRNSGCGTTENSLIVKDLACGTRYYARVWTSAGGGLYSTTSFIETKSCASAISRPMELAVIYTTKTTARLDWDPGKDNSWFCVDTATSRADLLDLTGSWRNHHCWTTSTLVTATGLTCETTYYWRVYAWNRITNAHSDVRTFRTDDCDTKQVKAPIEGVDVDKVGNEYHARIVVGRPNTCHSFGSYAAGITGTIVEITVYNQVRPNACAEVYSTYILTLNLGGGFFSGVTYIVKVNDDKMDIFTAD